MTVKNGTFTSPIAYAFINDSIDNTAAVSLLDFGFTNSQLLAADVVFIGVEDDDIRWRIDGDLANGGASPDPTTTTGFFTAQDKSLEVWGRQNISQLKMISVAGTATLNIQLSRYGGAP
jgi:hypothetical protein